jgi:uncharacterized protein YjiS (DUF1127 family)
MLLGIAAFADRRAATCQGIAWTVERLVAGRLVAAVRRHRERRAAVRLESMSDWLLKDVGVARSELGANVRRAR